MVYEPRFPKYEGHALDKNYNKFSNAVEFIEVVEEKELGEVCWKEVQPSIIANPKNEMEKVFNQWAGLAGVIVRPLEMMYNLVESGEIVEIIPEKV